MSLTYFKSGLNYTLANEDTALELALLPDGAGHVLSVAGSGGRAMPLLARSPKLLTCVDVSEPQLYLTELRVESVRALEHSEFLAFWGYPPEPASREERKELFSRIRLSSKAAEFFEKVFEAKSWDPILYDGKWEDTFVKLSRVNRALTGTAGLQLFSAMTMDEHREYMRSCFPSRAWALVVSLLGNGAVFNALLYKGHFPKKNIPDSHYRFYRESFRRVFAQGPARRNFFLQLLFFGKLVFAEGCPVEAHPDVFHGVKKALSSAEVRYRQGSVLEIARDADVPIEFLSISDVPSYFSGETERSYLKQISKGLSAGARVVARNYLRVPNADRSGYSVETENFRREIDSEKVGVYLPEVLRWEG